ncbi:hypothetical protein [Thermococcus waiotapuensis]|uniref:Uncharacterized protein n=1 Tax=Thermococcus waiotapuensis TaxID=90909 RepID=A0AAE4NW28_9EURY|nr:hypothetical protein [Thermococcus waiotapuensis]MDV3104307.1 hypothetical protein [Thermococcus waiotapuensis]
MGVLKSLSLRPFKPLSPTGELVALAPVGLNPPKDFGMPLNQNPSEFEPLSFVRLTKNLLSLFWKPHWVRKT